MKWLLIAAAIASSCGSPIKSSDLSGPPTSPATHSYASPSSPAASTTRPPQPSPTLPAELRDTKAVRFRSTDGIELEGRLFGTGTVGVVLAHGAVDDGEASWYSFAQTLSDHGYIVLTVDLRGFCPGGINGCSDGTQYPPDTWKDVTGAAQFLRGRGAARVVLMGASLGARSCVWAASRPGAKLDGVIGVSTPEYAVAAYRPAYDFTADLIGGIHVPILLVAGDRDGDLAAEATEMFGWANEPKTLTIVKSAAHGAPLLQDPDAASSVLKFLREQGSKP